MIPVLESDGIFARRRNKDCFKSHIFRNSLHIRCPVSKGVNEFLCRLFGRCTERIINAACRQTLNGLDSISLYSIHPIGDGVQRFRKDGLHGDVRRDMLHIHIITGEIISPFYEGISLACHFNTRGSFSVVYLFRTEAASVPVLICHRPYFDVLAIESCDIHIFRNRSVRFVPTAEVPTANLRG